MPNRRHILVIEDNPGDVRLVREALKDMSPNVQIHVAADGDEALLFLSKQGQHATAPTPHMIFLDFNLPKSDSKEVLRRIKTDPKLRLIPVAVLTTSESEKDVEEAYDLFANCYLRKPVDLDSFFEIVRSSAHFWLDVAFTPSSLDFR